MNEGEDMEFLNEEMLRNLSAEEMEQLRREMRNLNRRLREELGRRTRYCAYCGDRLGASDYGFRYCSAWHRYLDGHKQKATLSRVEFERRRALSRIRTIKKEPGTGATLSNDSNLDRVKELRASPRNLKIRRVLNEYRTITGESLNKSMRDSRRYKTTDQ
jgi:peptidoglycan/xylan/chitin deacetylase (PgdA/CDA1 family)